VESGVVRGFGGTLVIRSDLNIQGFTRDGLWTKPENAGRVDVIIQSSGAGGTCQQRGTDGERRLMSYDAATLPSQIPITVGRGGGGGLCGNPACPVCSQSPQRNEGSDGYVVIITTIPIQQ
jgi:hypothetical protein